MIKRVTEIVETTMYIGDKLVVLKEEVQSIRIIPDKPED